MDQLWTISTDGSRVDNVHGWITCGKFPRVGHMWTVGYGWSTCGRKGFPLRLINQSETALQNYMVYVCIHVENVGPKPHYCTYYPHVPVCTHGFHAWLPCGHMVFHVLYMCYSWDEKFVICFHMASARNYHVATCDEKFVLRIHMASARNYHVVTCALHVTRFL